jgi:hypothetical protein
MAHPFEVGETYRNRKGEYEVVSLHGSRMVIRYTDGSLLQTTVDMQKRIWQNIQMEAQLEREQQRAAARPRLKRRGGRRGLDFQGLAEHDFQAGVAGTSWRARANFGGRLAEHMTDTMPYFFQSYALYRQAMIHIAQPEHYSTKTKWREAKYEFALDAEQARFGFYIEKNDGPMDGTWHWPNLMAALEGDAALRHKVETAMREHQLRWDLYIWADVGLLARVRAGAEGLLCTSKNGAEQEATSMLAFIKRLRELEADKWADLVLYRTMSKAEALAEGAGLADPVAEVYRALLPLYEASTRQGRFVRSRA